MRAFAWKSRSSKKTSSPLARGPFAAVAFVEKAFGLEGDVVVRRAAGVSFSVVAQLELHVVPPADPNEAPRVLHVASIDGADVAAAGAAPGAAGAAGAPGTAGAGGEGGADVAGADAAAGEEAGPRTARLRFAEVDGVDVAQTLAGRRLLASQAEIARAGGAVPVGDDERGGRGAACVNDAARGGDAGSAFDASGDAPALAPRGVLGCTVCDERYGELGELAETISTPANEVWVVRGAYGEVLVPVVDECVASVVPDADGRLFTHVIDGIVDEGGGRGGHGEGEGTR